MREIVSWRVPTIDARSRRDTGRFDRLRTVGEPVAVPTDQDEQKVDELMAVRQRRLAKHRVVRVLERADRAFEKAQAERRIAAKQRRYGRVVDVADDAGTERLRAGLVFAVGEE